MKYIWKNVIDMPPAWLVIFVVITWLQKRYFPVFPFHAPLATTLGWALIAIGIGISLWSIIQFRDHKTSVIPRQVPSALIAAGPYRFSRNPIYLADAIVLAGVALLYGTLIGLVLVAVFMRLIEVRFIRGEEAGLQKQFPDNFKAFFAKTRRWL